MIGAGDLKDRFDFASRATNARGQVTGAFVVRLSRAARVLWDPGGEAAVQQRQAGQQPIRLTIYDSPEARAIASDWRATDRRRGIHYKVTAGAVPSREGPAFLDILAVGLGDEG